MELFKCYMCSLVSEDQNKVKVHMKLAHNMKVEDDDMLVEKLMCPIYTYSVRNVIEFKNHMTTIHKTVKWNWSLDLKAVHFCNQCDFELPEKAMLKTHK